MRQTGVVKCFAAGWGFITDSNHRDIFVHWSAIQASGFKQLFPGDVCAFEVEQNERGVHAIRVQKIGEAPL